MRTINIAMLGLGTVGTGVYKVLTSQRKRYQVSWEQRSV